MNQSEVRETLAAAASAVDGVTVAPGFRQLSRPGDGSVRLGRIERGARGFGWVATWGVWVRLPDDLAAAEKWMDERAMAIADALSEHIVVASVTPMQFNDGAKTVPCVVIEGTRETE